MTSWEWITAIVEDSEPEPSFVEAAWVQRVIADCQLKAPKKGVEWRLMRS